MKQKICPICDGRLNGNYCPVCRKLVKKPLEWDTDYYLNEGRKEATVRSGLPAGKEMPLGKPPRRRSSAGLIITLIIFVLVIQVLAGAFFWPAILDAGKTVFAPEAEEETIDDWEDIFDEEELLPEESEEEKSFGYSEELISEEEAIASGKRCDNRHFSAVLEEVEPELEIYLLEKGFFVEEQEEVSVNQVYQYSNLPSARVFTDYRTTKAWHFEEPGREDEEYYSSLMLQYDTVTHEIHDIEGYFYDAENAKEALEWGMDQINTLQELSPEERGDTAEQLLADCESSGGALFRTYPVYNNVMQTDSDGMIVFWMEPSVQGDYREEEDSQESEKIYEAQSAAERNYMNIKH